MPIFSSQFYSMRPKQFCDVEGYELALRAELTNCRDVAEHDEILRDELVEITRHVTDGIRDLVKYNRYVRDLVLYQGVIPLASWTDAIDARAAQSVPAMRSKIFEMKRELETGRVSGLPGTMILEGKPNFTTLEPFYMLIFEIYDETR